MRKRAPSGKSTIFAAPARSLRGYQPQHRAAEGGGCCGLRLPLPMENHMANKQMQATAAPHRRIIPDGAPGVGREELIDLLNEDLAREYQAVIAYVVYSQVLKGAEY